MTLTIRARPLPKPLPVETWLVAGVCVALVAAHFWQFEFMPGRVRSLWGPYFIGPVAWPVAAAVAWYALRRLSAPAVEHEVTRATVLWVAGLIGCFVVALHLLAGTVAEFGRSPYEHSPRWLAINFLFAGGPLVAVEMSRTAILRASRGRWLTAVLMLTSLGLAAVQLPLRQYQLDEIADSASFWGSVFIPMAATGLLAGFFVLYGGFWAGLLISAPLVAFTYYSPILPVVPWPIAALIGVAGPACGLWIAENLFGEAQDEEVPQGRGLSLPSVAWVLTSLVALTIFWFSFGFFGYQPSFVPSHSMEPLIKQGDIVIAGPIEPGDVEVGDIILYNTVGGRQVLHRVVDITTGEGGERQFIFKGDNNNAEDLKPIVDEQIAGRYIMRVPKLGWLPIKFNQWVVSPLR